MRIATFVVLAVGAAACQDDLMRRPVVRLSSGGSDTVIVNHRRPTPISLLALDASGREVIAAPIRYDVAAGSTVPITSGGIVTCTESADLTVRATLGDVVAIMFVQCRPVENVRIQGPVQFILGDSVWEQPRMLPLEAFGVDGQPVVQFTGVTQVQDSAVAMPHGLTLHPASRGITHTFVRVGDRSAGMGVHIYQRVRALADLDTLLQLPPEHRLFAVPLRLARGEVLRQKLPPGGWMLSTLPAEDDDPNGLRLRVEGGACQSNLLNIRGRLGCEAGTGTTLVIYRSAEGRKAPIVTGYLLVRWLFQL